MTIEDSLISGERGVTANTGGMVADVTTVRNTTIIGGAYGVYVDGSSAGAATLTLNSSILHQPATPLGRDGGLGTANLTALYSNYTGMPFDDGAGTLMEGPGNTSFADPGFVNPGGDDYALGSSAPVRDLGNPASFPQESTTDIAGNPRISNGRRDMGAFEFQFQAPTPPKCAGKTATISGSAGRDTIQGTAAADVIAALAGNDIVRGLGRQRGRTG